jgi:hypothetical protein
VKLSAYLHVVPRLRASGAVPPLSCKSSWRAQGKLYLLFYDILTDNVRVCVCVYTFRHLECEFVYAVEKAVGAA